MTSSPATDGKVLVISGEAGSVDEATSGRIRDAFPDHECIEFTATKALTSRLREAKRVVVAGGDGSVGYVARSLAGTEVDMGIIPVGTFNNFALSLSIPTDVDSAIQTARHGRVRSVALGAVEGHPFLETASIGLFGEAIRLGETLKERMLKEFPARARGVLRAPHFEFSLGGDIHGRGHARSLVFSNTSTSGTNMPVGESTPLDDTLDLAIRVGASRRDLLARVIGSLVFRRQSDARGIDLAFRKLTVDTSPRMKVWADDHQVAETPVTITCQPAALGVIVPA